MGPTLTLSLLAAAAVQGPTFRLGLAAAVRLVTAGTALPASAAPAARWTRVGGASSGQRARDNQAGLLLTTQLAAAAAAGVVVQHSMASTICLPLRWQAAAGVAGLARWRTPLRSRAGPSPAAQCTLAAALAKLAGTAPWCSRRCAQAPSQRRRGP